MLLLNLIWQTYIGIWKHKVPRWNWFYSFSRVIRNVDINGHARTDCQGLYVHRREIRTEIPAESPDSLSNRWLTHSKDNNNKKYLSVFLWPLNGKFFKDLGNSKLTIKGVEISFCFDPRVISRSKCKFCRNGNILKPTLRISTTPW